MRFHHPLYLLPLVVAACAHTSIPSQKPVGPKEAQHQRTQISEYIRRVFQDRDGNLWFGTNSDGVCRYDGKDLTYFSIKEGLAGSAIRGIVQDSSGAMWFATDGGVSRYDSGKFTNFTTANGLSDNGIWSMMLDRSGALWVGTQAGVCRFDGRAFVPFPIPRVKVDNPASRFSPEVVFAMCQDQKGNLWFGTDGEGVAIYDGKAFKALSVKDGLAGNQIRSAYCDRKGRVWIGTEENGVTCFDGVKVRTFTSKEGLSNNRIYGIYEDRSGKMWFSTLGDGVCRYDGTSFTSFRDTSGLTKNHVQSMFEDRDGTMWFGFSGGLFRLEGKSLINVTREGPWPTSKQNPMEPFSRMMPGEWRVTFPGGAGMVDKWQWGPGKHSVRAITHEFNSANREPWREIQVFYWHPGRKQICMLAISSYARSVSEGTMTFLGDKADGVADLYQTGVHRKMGLRWVFQGLDKYTDTLLESTGSDGLKTLVEWEPTRSMDGTPLPPAVAGTTPNLTGKMEAFAPLKGRTWQGKGFFGLGKKAQVQASFEWIPYADVMIGRVVDPSQSGEATPLLDLYLFHHTGKDKLYCLALSSQGGVYEGEVVPRKKGTLQLNLTGYERNETTSQYVEFYVQPDGSLRQSVWTKADSKQVPLFVTEHKRKG